MSIKRHFTTEYFSALFSITALFLGSLSYFHFFTFGTAPLNKTIKLHHKKYLNDKYAPAWKTLEFFSFGTILKIYKNLIETDIKERISRFYGVKDIHKFINFMETIVLIRNICAHSAVLYDFKTPKGISLDERDRHSIYPCINYILGVISETRQIEMNDKLKNLFLGHKNNEVISKLLKMK